MGRFAEGTGTAEINAEPTAAQSDFVLGHRRDLEIIHPGSSIRDNRCEYFILKSCSRSEEHTSELQSLMRISYAVFCLKKKKKIQQKQHTQEQMPNITEQYTHYQA